MASRAGRSGATDAIGLDIGRHYRQAGYNVAAFVCDAVPPGSAVAGFLLRRWWGKEHRMPTIIIRINTSWTQQGINRIKAEFAEKLPGYNFILLSDVAEVVILPKASE